MKLTFPSFSRQPRTGVLFNLTENQLQLARLRMNETPVPMDCMTEYPPDDANAVENWRLTNTLEKDSRGRLPTYCGFHPVERVLARVQINTRRLSEPDYLTNLVADQAKISSAKEWLIRALNPLDGTPLTNDGTIRSGLLFGVPWSAIRATQAKLLDLGLRPHCLECTTLPLLGILTKHIELTGYKHAVVVCEIERERTRVYILARDGIHTLPALPHGLNSITEAAMKKLGTDDPAAARVLLETPDEQTLASGTRLVRLLARHLKPALDQFELQTGQRIDEIYCAQLPDKLHWLGQKIGEAVSLQVLEPALQAASVQFLTEGAEVGQQWLSPLSLLTNFNQTGKAGTRPPIPVPGRPAPGTSWHVDCRLVSELPEDRVVGTRFLVHTIYGGVTLGLALLFGWLLYSNYSVRSQIKDWEKHMGAHALPMKEIRRLQGQFSRDSVKIDEAYGLMKQSPVLPSQFIELVGRSRPPLVVFDSIQSGGAGTDSILVHGTLHASSERASRLLGGYIDTLRANKDVGPLFSAIILTNLERQDAADRMNFEITFRVKPGDKP